MAVLSSRLSTIAEFVPQGSNVCDVGTDHGYLAIELLKSGKAKGVIATDIAEKPLKNARNNIENLGVTGISLRLCNGLSAVEPDETDAVIIAGMGGEVIAGILERGNAVTARENVTLILQPTTSPEYLRRFLYESGYEILTEKAVFENNKLYSVMLVNYTGKIHVNQDYFYFIGKLIPHDEAAILYIKKQQTRVQKCMQCLENIAEKNTEYLYYKSVFYGIKEYLKSFIGEGNNGI